MIEAANTNTRETQPCRGRGLKKRTDSDAGGSPPIGGAAGIFGRSAEMTALSRRLDARRSFLFHGPAGAGKTLLLSAALAEVPGVLYSAHNPTPQALYRRLAELLLAADCAALRKSCPLGPASLDGKSATSLKGLVRDALTGSRYLLVLDHLVSPSQTLAACIRELMLSCSVPVVAVSRSAHMEDAGFVLRLFPERAERLALRNLDAETAPRFAQWCAGQEGIAAANLSQFLEKVVEHSEGNPGAIRQMVRMAMQAKYRHDGQIKVAPLYIDYKLSTMGR